MLLLNGVCTDEKKPINRLKSRVWGYGEHLDKSGCSVDSTATKSFQIDQTYLHSWLHYETLDRSKGLRTLFGVSFPDGSRFSYFRPKRGGNRI